MRTLFETVTYRSRRVSDSAEICGRHYLWRAACVSWLLGCAVTSSFALEPLSLDEKAARVEQHVNARDGSLDVEGPVEVAIAAPRREVSLPNEQRAVEVEPAPATPSSHVVATLRAAGPSAVLAAKRLRKPAVKLAGKPELLSLSFGESLFLTESLRTPPLVTKWADGASANGSGVIDPQIAVSRSLVAVLTWDTLAFYDKSGALATGFPNPTSTETIFAGLLPTIDASLHLNSQAAGNPNFLMENGQVGDARVAFDNFRKRWVVAATAKNNSSNLKNTVSTRLRLSQRRTKFLLAISKTEDPAQGFHTYFFNGTPNDGACDSTSDSSPCPGSSFTPGNAGDYPSLGISKTHYMITSHVAHEPLDGSSGTALFGYLVTLNADAAASGSSSVNGHAFWNWSLADEGTATFVTMPVVMENDLPLAGAGWGVIASAANNHLALTGVSPANPPTLVSMSWDIPDMQGAPTWPQKGNSNKITYGNVGNEPIAAMLFDKTLVTGFDDARTWTNEQSTASPSLHLFSIDLTPFPVVASKVKDRVIGLRNSFDDKPNDIVGYGLPGMAVNKDGDIAVVYGRTSSKLFMETRFSTWLHNEADIRPSRILQSGQASIGAQHPDTAGVALDPFDNQGIWMAHEFASSSGPRIAVGKVFGKAHSNLVITDASATNSPKFHRGDPITVNFTMANQGDGTAPGANGEALLVIGRREISLGKSVTADLKSGHSVTGQILGKIPRSTGRGSYTVEVRAKLKSGTAEYRSDDNTLKAGRVTID